jgi:hypothetical protein
MGKYISARLRHLVEERAAARALDALAGDLGKLDRLIDA